MTQASFSSQAYTPDRVVAGSAPLETRQITLVTPENRARGAVLGRIVGAVSAPVAFAGNTGNGTFAATPTVGAGVIGGDYKLYIIEPAAALGTFVLIAPDGTFAGRGTVGTAFAGQLAFTLNDGATDFVAGDGFTITVAVGTKYKLAATAATDGSHRAQCILAVATDATAADKVTNGYFRGDFDELALVYGTGHTAATVRADFDKYNSSIKLLKSQAVS